MLVSSSRVNVESNCFLSMCDPVGRTQFPFSFSGETPLLSLRSDLM